MYHGEKVSLRLFKEEDVDEIMKHFNNYEFKKHLGGVIPVTAKDELDFIKKSWDDKKNGTGYFFAIEDKKTKKLVGSTSIMDVNWIYKSATFGIGIWENDSQNKGYGTDATITILKFGFYELGLHSIKLGVFAFNERAKHVYEKVGFKETGRRREAYFVDGKFHDIISMDILDREFMKLHTKK